MTADVGTYLPQSSHIPAKLVSLPRVLQTFQGIPYFYNGVHSISEGILIIVILDGLTA